MTDAQPVPTPGPTEPPENGITAAGWTQLEQRVYARLGQLERRLGTHLDEAHRPAWLRPTEGESRWPVALAIVVTVGLQLFLPRDLAFHPKWLLPGLELLLLAALLVTNPTRINRESSALRALSLALVAVASLATAWAAVRLVYQLISGGAAEDAPALLVTGALVWLTNVLVFALWYWEMDRGGPAARANARTAQPDFLFPQLTVPDLVRRDWEPTFPDYLYVSFTNATAFSPTDTMPMSRAAKMLMMLQSAVSLATVVLVVARAVNVLR